MDLTFRSPFSYGISNSGERLPSNGLLLYLARPNSNEYLIGEDTYIWGYVLPDDADIRAATGWVSGTANVFYGSTGTPIVALATEIAAAILPANVVFSLVDATMQTGKLAIYTAETTAATLAKARSVLRDESINYLFYGRTAIAYDPQDLTTMYQDASGTLPVYRPGTGLVDPPVGLMLDKSQGLELGPELVVNPGPDFTRTTGFGGGLSLSVVDGRLRVTAPVGVTANSHLQVFPVLPAAGRYLIRIGLRLGTCPWIRGLTWGAGLIGFEVISADTDYESRQLATADTATIRIYFHTAAVPGDYFELTHISVREIKGYHAYQSTTTARPKLSGRYNLLTATETISTQSVTTVATNYTLRFEGTGSITLSGAATGTYTAGTHTITCTAGTLTCTVAGTVTRADLRVKRDGSSLPPYQRGDDANTYDTAGFPLFLKRDRVDDDLVVQAPAINGVSAWGAAEGSLFGKVNIAAGEYKPLGVITGGLTTCTQLIRIDGTLSASETAVLERFVARKSGTTYNVTTADPVVFQFDLTGVSTFSFTLQTRRGLPVLVDWGDGNTTAYAGATDQTATKTYAASGNYTVKVYAEDDSILTKFSTSAAGMSGTLSLPSGMTYFSCAGSNTLTGTLSLPSGITYFLCDGYNTLTGTLSLPSGITYFRCTGSNTLTGTLSLPSSMTYFYCHGFNTLSGTLSLPSSMTFFNCFGSNTLSGTLSLPSSMTHFNCLGYNTLSGTLSMPSGMTHFNCQGYNTLSGTLSMPSGMTYFVCLGYNTLSGTLSLPSSMTFFNCTGSNTISGYTPSAKASNQQRFFLTGQNTLSATDVDNILIDYDAAGGTWMGAKEITIQGNAANRTSASDAAYASLAAKLTTLNVD